MSGSAWLTTTIAERAGPFAGLREAGIDVALRAGNLRMSPHVHNDEGDVQSALAVLDRRA